MTFEEINNNLLQKEWKERYSKQTLEVQRRLDELYNQDPREYQLKVIKRKRIMPQKGDIFLLSPVDGIYFYGLVLNDGVCSINGNDLLVILIFKTTTKELTDERFKFDLNNLLIKINTVGKEYWSRGYFYNVGHICIDTRIDYGFYDVIDDKYYDEYGNVMQHRPHYLGMFGVSTITGIAYYVWKELIINKNLLEAKDDELDYGRTYQ